MVNQINQLMKLWQPNVKKKKHKLKYATEKSNYQDTQGK